MAHTSETRVLSFSWKVLFSLGILCILGGLYFLLIRPLFIIQPEDERVAKISAAELKTLYPDIFLWLTFVIRAWGAWIMGVGILFMGVSKYAYRKREKWAWVTLALSGLTVLLIHFTILVFMRAEGVFIMGPLLLLFILAFFLPYKEFFK